ncbi:MAG: choice-of-anchor D domain-containing protein [Halomonadaceae bacterium]|nr:MAG: choice-of-anchor D domain-containing protein [Halomonadaceae bacterium]
MRTRSKTSNRHRLSTAIAAALLLGAGGSAVAVEQANLVLEYECPLPLIGNQILSANISAEIPTEESVGDSQTFTVTAITTVPEDARTGLAVGRAVSIEGTALSSAFVRTVARDIPAEVELTVPQTSVADGTGPFDLPAEGISPSVTLEEQDIGEAEIRIGDLFLDIITREANGTIAIQPIGEFTSQCTQLPDQNNLLHTFTIVGDNGDDPDPDPSISVSPEAIDFGVVQANTSSDQQLTITNAGGNGLDIEGISIEGPDADLFSYNADCNSLGADESCSVTVTYSATGEEAHEANLVIASNDPETPQVTVPLSGSSEEVPQAAISVDPESLSFGTVQPGQTPEQTITVSNTGGASLGIQNVSLSGPDANVFTLSEDCNSLEPTNSCSIVVTYLAEGNTEHNATVIIESDAPESATVEVPVTGTSEIEPTAALVVDPEAVDFGTVELGATQNENVILSNTGGAPLTIEGINISGEAAEDFTQVSDCTTLGQNEECTITVTYSSNVDAERNAVMTILSDDPNRPEVDVTLTASAEAVTPPGEVDLQIEGETFIRSAQGTLPITGNLIADYDEASGILSGFLDLQRTEGQLRISRLFRRMTATVAVDFEEVEETTGVLEDGTLATESRLYFRVPHATINFFGVKLPLAGGEECRTMDPVALNLSSPEGESFSIAEGGQLTGEYDMPPLENCGPLTNVLNNLLAGANNTMDLVLTDGVENGNGDEEEDNGNNDVEEDENDNGNNNNEDVVI